MIELEQDANARGLTIAGGFHPTGDDGLAPELKTILLLAPNGSDFWAQFTASPFYRDGKPDPVDRWSRHEIGRWACALQAKAFFPFGGPPYHPFYSWALRSGRAFASPINLLVHVDQGLMISFRGALGLKERVALPKPAASPCARCQDKPCKTACPVDALDHTGYDVPICKTHLASDPPCMQKGCAARRACPLSQTFDRPDAQSAFHMKAFR